MKIFLITSWIIIIIGGTFIGIHYVKPQAAIEKPIQTAFTNDNLEELDSPDYETKEIKNFSQYISQGDTNMTQQDYEMAVTNYKSAVVLNPSSVSSLIKLGQAYLKNSSPKLAQNVFLKAVKLKPESLSVRLLLLQSHLDLNDLAQAKKLAWSLNENDPRVVIYKGIISTAYKNFDEAKAEFKKVANDETIKDSKYKEQANRYLEAFTTYSYFTEADRNFLKLLLAKALVDDGQYQTAIPMLFEITNEQNNYRDAWITMGYSYLKTHKPKEAIDAFTQAKILDPEKPETLFFLGLAHFGNNELEKAIKYLELAKENGYEPVSDIQTKLANLYILKEDFKKSEEIFSSLQIQDTSNIALATQLVWLNIDKLNNPEKALKIALKIYSAKPTDAMSLNLLGWAYTANEDYINGDKFLKNAISADPNLDAAYLNLGWLNEKTNKEKIAQTYYKKAQSINKTSSIAKLATVRYNNIISGINSPTISQQ